MALPVGDGGMGFVGQCHAAAFRVVAVKPAFAKLFADQERRHAWLVAASAKVRRWRAEDEAKGQPWGGQLSTDQDNEEQA
jgi:hypothetical protein